MESCRKGGGELRALEALDPFFEKTARAQPILAPISGYITRIGRWAPVFNRDVVDATTLREAGDRRVLFDIAGAPGANGHPRSGIEAEGAAWRDCTIALRGVVQPGDRLGSSRGQKPSKSSEAPAKSRTGLSY